MSASVVTTHAVTLYDVSPSVIIPRKVMAVKIISLETFQLDWIDGELK